MSIALLVVTDGRRDYLSQALASALTHLHGPVSEWWLFDDTGDPAARAELAAALPTFRHINAGPRVGFGGAIASAWQQLAAGSHADWVFHLEQDFVFRRPVDLAAVADVMTPRLHLVQMALRRQPWNAAEHAAGGVVELNPGAYVQIADRAGRVWLEHRQFFTTNPCLYRRALCVAGWPAGASSEGVFTHRLLADGAHGVPGDQVWFGYWGARSSEVWVEHIGHQRTGGGY